MIQDQKSRGGGGVHNVFELSGAADWGMFFTISVMAWSIFPLYILSWLVGICFSRIFSWLGVIFLFIIVSVSHIQEGLTKYIFSTNWSWLGDSVFLPILS